MCFYFQHPQSPLLSLPTFLPLSLSFSPSLPLFLPLFFSPSHPSYPPSLPPSLPLFPPPSLPLVFVRSPLRGVRIYKQLRRTKYRPIYFDLAGLFFHYNVFFYSCGWELRECTCSKISPPLVIYSFWKRYMKLFIYECMNRVDAFFDRPTDAVGYARIHIGYVHDISK